MRCAEECDPGSWERAGAGRAGSCLGAGVSELVLSSAVWVKIHFGGAGSSTRAWPSFLLHSAQTPRAAGSGQSTGTCPEGVCALGRHKMPHERSSRIDLVETTE